MSEPSPNSRNTSALVGAGLTIVTAFTPLLFPAVPKIVYAVPIMFGFWLMGYGAWPRIGEFIKNNNRIMPLATCTIVLLFVWPILVLETIGPTFVHWMTDSSRNIDPYFPKSGVVAAPLALSTSPVAAAPATDAPQLPAAEVKPVLASVQTTTRTTKFFYDMIHSHNPMMLKSLISPYLGMTLQVEGSIVNINQFAKDYINAGLIADGKLVVLCRFSLEYTKYLMQLDIGATIQVKGIITDQFDQSGMTLDECEPSK